MISNLSNNEILLDNLNLINTCISYQVTKYNQYRFIDDIKQDIYLIILNYDNEKLNKIVDDKRMNAFITGILVNQLYSRTSPFYRRYRKFSEEIAPFELIEITSEKN